MHKLAVLAMASLISITASAADWSFVNEDKIATSYVDTDSISSSSIYKTAFFKSELAEPMYVAEEGFIDEIVAFSQYDCRSTPKRIKVLTFVGYHDDNYIFEVDEEEPWKVVYPESTSESIANFVCSY